MNVALRNPAQKVVAESTGPDSLRLDVTVPATGARPVRFGSAALRGCPVHDLRDRLRGAGLRPTRQRVALGWLLFAKGDRHLTAEALYEEAMRAKVHVSLATVYNTLNQFTEAGLLRQVAVEGSRSYFDTNIGDHHHFFVEDDDTVMDIPASRLAVSDLPAAPAGFEVVRVDVVVRLRRTTV